MDKKPLIEMSICAVILLVLGSLSNVVGYQSVKSTAVSNSPLFTTRTQRAINQQQNLITSQYLGMRKHNLLQFPIRENTTEQLKKAIEIISKMDDKTFQQFTELCIQRIKQDKSFKDTNANDIVKALTLLKTKSVSIINTVPNRNNQFISVSNTICDWVQGCFASKVVAVVILAIVFVIVFIYFAIIDPFLEKRTLSFTCGPYCIPPCSFRNLV